MAHSALACELLAAAVAAGASRQVAAAIASALFRTATSEVADTDSEVVKEQVEARLRALRPCLKAQVIAGTVFGVQAHTAKDLVPADTVRRANAARHHAFREDFAALTATDIKRAQRGGDRGRKLACDAPGADPLQAADPWSRAAARPPVALPAVKVRALQRGDDVWAKWRGTKYYDKLQVGLEQEQPCARVQQGEGTQLPQSALGAAGQVEDGTALAAASSAGAPGCGEAMVLRGTVPSAVQQGEEKQEPPQAAAGSARQSEVQAGGKVTGISDAAVAVFKPLVVDMYRKVNPAKVANFDRWFDRRLAAYAGDVEQLFLDLHAKYVGRSAPDVVSYSGGNEATPRT